ncbi:Hypothetical_protein [Hexamita inflata]|uniref:Hypothetical_protein n=1 Tax=Hexamita inflata TaxID=28002 RepID=A0AA86QRT5_9EUKA|nr:Hypothetical protein HINF_LOCUS47167 [Hexamita inflata]
MYTTFALTNKIQIYNSNCTVQATCSVASLIVDYGSKIVIQQSNLTAMFTQSTGQLESSLVALTSKYINIYQCNTSSVMSSVSGYLSGICGNVETLIINFSKVYVQIFNASSNPTQLQSGAIAANLTNSIVQILNSTVYGLVNGTQSGALVGLSTNVSIFADDQNISVLGSFESFQGQGDIDLIDFIGVRTNVSITGTAATVFQQSSGINLNNSVIQFTNLDIIATNMSIFSGFTFIHNIKLEGQINFQATLSSKYSLIADPAGKLQISAIHSILTINSSTGAFSFLAYSVLDIDINCLVIDGQINSTKFALIQTANSGLISIRNYKAVGSFNISGYSNLGLITLKLAQITYKNIIIQSQVSFSATYSVLIHKSFIENVSPVVLFQRIYIKFPVYQTNLNQYAPSVICASINSNNITFYNITVITLVNRQLSATGVSYAILGVTKSPIVVVQNCVFIDNINKFQSTQYSGLIYIDMQSGTTALSAKFLNVSYQLNAVMDTATAVGMIASQQLIPLSIVINGLKISTSIASTTGGMRNGQVLSFASASVSISNLNSTSSFLSMIEQSESGLLIGSLIGALSLINCSVSNYQSFAQDKFGLISSVQSFSQADTSIYNLSIISLEAQITAQGQSGLVFGAVYNLNVQIMNVSVTDTQLTGGSQEISIGIAFGVYKGSNSILQNCSIQILFSNIKAVMVVQYVIGSDEPVKSAFSVNGENVKAKYSLCSSVDVCVVDSSEA